jgi:uncharacterized protein (DUF433 family)
MGGPRRFSLGFRARTNYGQRIRRKGDGGYDIAGTQVSLDSIIYEFLNGTSPESIRHSSSAITLAQVYGGITFYLANRTEIDECLEDADRDLEKLRLEARRKESAAAPKIGPGETQ